MLWQPQVPVALLLQGRCSGAHSVSCVLRCCCSTYVCGLDELYTECIYAQPFVA